MWLEKSLKIEKIHIKQYIKWLELLTFFQG